MEPIRVLHVLHSMNRGGTENAIMNYYRNIDRTKVQFDFLLTEQGKCNFEDEIISLGGRIYRVPILSMFNPFSYIRAVNSFFKHYQEYKIIHSHTSSKSVIPLYIAKRNRVPVRISHSHSTLSEKGIKGYIRNFLMPFIKTTANVYMACGEKAGEWLYGKKFMLEGNVEIVRNVINADLFRYDELKRVKMRADLKISPDTFVVGHIARFSIEKNHSFALKVFKSLVNIHPNSLYLLVGDGELRSEIEEQIQSLELVDKVKIVGVVPNVYDYMQAMDISVLPSLYEGLPLSLVESQVSGLPCVTTAGSVSEECSITDLVTYLSLDESPDLWAQVYLESIRFPRFDRYNEIKSEGYDASTSAWVLQERYLELYNQFT